jgi:hypothetical protein
MYDAVTRATYENMIKAAEASLPAQISTSLLKVAARLPAVRDELLRVTKEKR